MLSSAYVESEKSEYNKSEQTLSQEQNKPVCGIVGSRKRRGKTGADCANDSCA